MKQKKGKTAEVGKCSSFLFTLFFLYLYTMQNRNLTPVDLLWVMFIYLTITDFNWWFLALSIIFCPLWAEIYHTAKIKQEANKRNKTIIEQFENDLENEN